MANPSTNVPIILASASPRREALLKQIGLPFRVEPSGVSEEKAQRPGDPASFVEQAALAKAEDVAARVRDGLVLGADTVVVVGGRVLGKPTSAAEAREMLASLSGVTHDVYTGLALVQVEDGSVRRRRTAHEATRVTFRRLSRDDIEGYVATGEPMDKAGAYGIQGRGAVLVERIEGCYSNVVGLPVARLVEMLRDFGISVWEASRAANGRAAEAEP
ncbi:MAG: septum formation inhibitor Maf [Armatimonadota bacterium]|nr:MAG: septum formation inhibitor Maf [Armatimonadota bacterium]